MTVSPLGARHRSPLGAFYRTPLGALGPAPSAVSGWVGSVISRPTTDWGTGGAWWSRTGAGAICGGNDATSNASSPWAKSARLKIGFAQIDPFAPPLPLPNDSSWIGWILTGVTSGATVTLGADMDSNVCNRTESSVVTVNTWWSASVWDDSGQDRPEFSQVANFRPSDNRVSDRWFWQASYNDQDPPDFEVDEDVTIVEA